MTDPITWTLVGSEPLKGGIKFLYDQTGELLKEWRSRAKKDAEPALGGLTTRQSPPAAAFLDSTPLPEANFNALEKLQEEIAVLRKALANIADGVEDPDIADSNLLSVVDSLRLCLEAIYGRRFSFAGEQRPDRPVVDSSIDAETVQGLVKGVVAAELGMGEIRSRIHARNIGPGGSIVGVELGKVK